MSQVLCWAISQTLIYFSPIDNPLSQNEYPHYHRTVEKSVVRFVFQKDDSDSTREYGLEEASREAGKPMRMSVRRLGQEPWGCRGGMGKIW